MFVAEIAEPDLIAEPFEMHGFDPEVNGKIMVHMGRDHVDYNNYVALMEQADLQLTLNDLTLPANSRWKLARRAVTPCGLVSEPSEVLDVRIDSEGNMAYPVPNIPYGLAIKLLTAGSFELHWIYSFDSQEIEPEKFEILVDSGSGYQVAGDVSCWSGKSEYKFVSGEYTHGQLIRVAVRSATSNAASACCAAAFVMPDNLGPEAINGLNYNVVGNNDLEVIQVPMLNIYKGQDGNIDYTTPVASIDPASTSVTIESLVLPPNTRWDFVSRLQADCGLESEPSAAVVVLIDSEGNMIMAKPNRPSELTIQRLDAGKFKLRFRYDSADQEIAPEKFYVFIDSGSGFDLSDRSNEVAYKGSAEYSWLSGSYDHGKVVRFKVAAFANNQLSLSDSAGEIADHLGPDAITGLRAIVELAYD